MIQYISTLQNIWVIATRLQSFVLSTLCIGIILISILLMVLLSFILILRKGITCQTKNNYDIDFINDICWNIDPILVKEGIFDVVQMSDTGLTKINGGKINDSDTTSSYEPYENKWKRSIPKFIKVQ